MESMNILNCHLNILEAQVMARSIEDEAKEYSRYLRKYYTLLKSLHTNDNPYLVNYIENILLDRNQERITYMIATPIIEDNKMLKEIEQEIITYLESYNLYSK